MAVHWAYDLQQWNLAPTGHQPSETCAAEERSCVSIGQLWRWAARRRSHGWCASYRPTQRPGRRRIANLCWWFPVGRIWYDFERPILHPTRRYRPCTSGRCRTWALDRMFQTRAALFRRRTEASDAPGVIHWNCKAIIFKKKIIKYPIEFKRIIPDVMKC